MKRVLAIALLAACVPSTESRTAAGAAGVVTEPSAASRGEPFVTADGWTLVIDSLILQAEVAVVSQNGQQSAYGSTTSYLWDARRRVELFTPALELGSWLVRVAPRSRYLTSNGFDEIENLGVETSLEARFYQPVVTPFDAFGDDFRRGPSALLVVRATKGTREVSMSVALGRPLGGSAPSVGLAEPVHVVLVEANALSTSSIRVDGSRFFLDDDRALRFDLLAAADADADGAITDFELASSIVPCRVCNAPMSGEEPHGPLLELVTARLPAVLDGSP